MSVPVCLLEIHTSEELELVKSLHSPDGRCGFLVPTLLSYTEIVPQWLLPYDNEVVFLIYYFSMFFGKLTESGFKIRAKLEFCKLLLYRI